MAQPEVDVSTSSFCDPAWIAMSGGWIHANNVLFYLSRSPFYDRMSANETVFVQAAGNPQREMLYLATRQKFEAELQKHIGVQYTVECDPLESQARIKSPTGVEEPSDVWVIKKALRENLQQSRDELQVLDYYFIANQTIFQAPRLDAILDYHMTNMTTGLKEMFGHVSSLPKFSATNGYTYFSGREKTQGQGRQSKAGSPVPESSQELAEASEMDIMSSEQTLASALRLAMANSGQFYDDAPLVGEPGSFRYAKGRDTGSVTKTQEPAKCTALVGPSKANTPVPSQTIKDSPAPTDIGTSHVNGAKDESQRPKPKRKKSAMINGTG